MSDSVERLEEARSRASSLVALLDAGVIGSKLVDSYGWAFHQLVWLNAGTTALVLVFIPFLPRSIMNRKDGEVLPGPTTTTSASAPAAAPVA